MKIVNVVCAPGRTGFFFDDQKAIKSGAVSDGAAYFGDTMTPGFKSIRQAGESISVMLVLEDGQVAWGDCAAVQYSGAGGRDPLFLAEDFIPVIDKYIKPALVGKEADNFRELTKMMEAIEVDGKRLHTAIRYGVSQAILDAVAKATKRLMSEVVADEYGTTVSDKPIPIFTQSGDNRYENADKMILKGAAILPHAPTNNVETKLGRDGSKLKEYVCWLRDRILKLRTDESYNPIFHVDVYGTIGQAFGDENYTAMADYLAELEEAAKPFHLRIEGPMDAGEREKQMLCLKGLREEVDRRAAQKQQGTGAHVAEDRPEIGAGVQRKLHEEAVGVGAGKRCVHDPAHSPGHEQVKATHAEHYEQGRTRREQGKGEQEGHAHLPAARDKRQHT